LGFELIETKYAYGNIHYAEISRSSPINQKALHYQNLDKGLSDLFLYHENNKTKRFHNFTI